MTIYNPKTDTLFDRDKKSFKVIYGAFRRPEFKIINEWHVTEKVDGMSVILEFKLPDSIFADREIYSWIHGRTHSTIFPVHVKEMLEAEVERISDDVIELMRDYDLATLSIYGEAYGAKVQKGGGRYSDKAEFRAFDMLVDEKNWLNPDQFAANCHELDVARCPDLGVHSTESAVRMARAGFPSQFARQEIPTCEGIVMKPAVTLRNNRGDRVMAKLKYSDFEGNE